MSNESPLCAVVFGNLSYVGYGRDYDETNEKNKTRFRDLVALTFGGCSGVMYQYEQLFYPTASTTKEDYDAYLAELRANPKQTLEGVVYYPSEESAIAAVASMNGAMINGKVLSVRLQNQKS